MACAICQQRPPRRHCPALQADICAPCCGEERERTIDCPFTCEYLLQAREREPMYELPRDYPNQDLDTSERFLQAQEPLLLLMAGTLFLAAGRANATDLDLRAALAAMIDSRRGVTGIEPGAIQKDFEERLAEFRERALVETGGERVFEDKSILRLLAFFQREEMQYNNRRPKSRAYVDWLRAYVSQVAAEMSKEAGS